MENEKNGPGQPPKPEVVDKYLLRFRKDKPYLKDKLKTLMKRSNLSSLNDFLIEVLDNYANSHYNPNNDRIEDLENKITRFFQNIHSKIRSLQLKVLPTIPAPTETPLLKEFIMNCFPNPLKRDLFYLNFIGCQIYSELMLLYEILDVNDSIVNKETGAKIDYTNYYCKKNNLDNSKREEIINKIISDFYDAWFLQLALYHVIKDKTNFEINITNLEDFIFSVLYPDLKIDPLLRIDEFGYLQTRWDKIIENVEENIFFSSEKIKEYSEFNLRNIILTLTLLEELELEWGLSTGLTHEELVNFMKDDGFKNTGVGREYISLKLLSYNVERIKKSYYRITKSHLYPSTPLFHKKPCEYNKHDFLLSLRSLFRLQFSRTENEYSLFFFLDSLIKDYPSEFSTPIMNYFVPSHIEFTPFIVERILNLNDYFNYLKKENALFNFCLDY